MDIIIPQVYNAMFHCIYNKFEHILHNQPDSYLSIGYIGVSMNEFTLHKLMTHPFTPGSVWFQI